MNDSTSTADHCMQFYDHQQPLMEGFSDAITVVTPNDHHLTPKISNPLFKPIKKRSRASKRTPITLLIANTTNFRSLVQQFTGCPTTTSAISSVAIHKGPITLNFQQESSKQQSTMPPLGVPLPWQSQPPPQQQLMQQHVKISSSFLPTAGMEVSDGLLMNGDFSLLEQSMNSFSNVLCDENVYKGFNYAMTP